MGRIKTASFKTASTSRSLLVISTAVDFPTAKVLPIVLL